MSLSCLSRCGVLGCHGWHGWHGRQVGAALVLTLWTWAAQAQSQAEPAPELTYALGSALVSAPTYAGSGQTQLALRPILALRYGRFGISTARGSTLLGFGLQRAETGVSADIFSTDRIRLGAALRTSSGRSAADDPALRGLPAIESTLQARLYLNYQLSGRWVVGSALTQDLLGRGIGASASVDLAYRDRITASSEWTAGAGLGFANARHMQTHFGVTPATALATGRAAFEPRAGVSDVHLGLGLTTALSHRWVLHATVGAARLLGDAAASPLTRRPASASASVGLVYRCCAPEMVSR